MKNSVSLDIHYPDCSSDRMYAINIRRDFEKIDI